MCPQEHTAPPPLGCCGWAPGPLGSWAALAFSRHSSSSCPLPLTCPSHQCDSIGQTPNPAVMPAAARAEQSAASTRQGQAVPSAIGQAVEPGCARLPTATSPRTGRTEDIKSPGGDSASPPPASRSPLWGQAQAVPVSPWATLLLSGAGLEVPSLLPACLVQGSALTGALPLAAPWDTGAQC